MKKTLMVLLAAALLLSACNKGGGEGGISDKALIGKWYSDKEYTSPIIEFKAGGKCIWGLTNNFEYAVKGTNIQVLIPGTDNIFVAIDNCKLDGKVLTCTIGYEVTLYKK
jgi:hypothetical protein